MAFYESRERHCPHCGERVSGTRPKCLNGGRYVEEPDEDDPEDEARSRKAWFLFLVVVAVGIGLVAVLALG